MADDENPGDSPELREMKARIEALCREWKPLHDRFWFPSLEPLDRAEEERMWRLGADITLHFSYLWRLLGGEVGHTALAMVAGTVTETLDGTLPRAWRREGRSNERRVTTFQDIGRRYAAAYNKAVNDRLFTSDDPEELVLELFGVRSEQSVKAWFDLDCDEQYEILRAKLPDTAPSPEELDRLRREEALRVLRWAAKMHRRRTL